MTPDDEGCFQEPLVKAPVDGVLYHPSFLFNPNPFPACRGIYVGGCIRGDRPEGESAHAHIHDDDEAKGIICVWRQRTIWQRDNWAPRLLMWHEYAHILEPDDGLLFDHAPSSPWGRLMERWGLTPSRVT